MASAVMASAVMSSVRKDDFFFKNPRELFMLFSGGEVSLQKPKPDPVPEVAKETVPLTVTSSSAEDTVLTNHPSLLGKVPILGNLFDTRPANSHDVRLQISVVLMRSTFAGLDVGNLLGDLRELGQELIKNQVTLQLVSNDVDPATGSGRVSKSVTFEQWTQPRNLLIPKLFCFNLDCFVSRNFGTPGAIILHNGHKNLVLPQLNITTEFKITKAQVTMPDRRVVTFLCDSWVYASEKDKGGRIFFANKVYTPAQTPPGLRKLRKDELKELQGDGTGERKEWERIYDYDVYNDLGTPEERRPILGGSAEYPYPRRCRTGRMMNPDGVTETLPKGSLTNNYIPRDEQFDDVKKSGFLGTSLKGKKHQLIANLGSHDEDFRSFDEVRQLYVPLGQESSVQELISNQQQPFELIRQFAFASGDDKNVFKYPTPRIIAADKDAWTEDVEFGRQVLAGMNPIVIEALKTFPPYKDMAATAEMVQPHLEGLTVQEALRQNRLFVLDYRERLLGYIQRINDLKSTQAYAAWTLFFLTEEGTLKPVCIELSLPGAEGGSPKSRVFLPAKAGAAKNWGWELAKAHVLSNDASFHQVISHWLRTHAVIEPFIIATNRQLSIMHPVHKALVAHFKNTMDINQSARKSLICAQGIVEQTFTPQKYALEISSKVYAGWRFVDEALPNDLIKRGMAVPDASAPHGLRLVIDDYPYAKDGLELWAAIRGWVKEHIDLFYPDDRAVQADEELQNWWTELRTKGHADINEGWIEADSKDNLVQIVTTVAWVASCHHAAVNFGQYLYAGFMPNHPAMTRKLIPEEGTPEWEAMQQNPEKYLLSMLANAVMTELNMTTIEILSTHSSNEEYLGERGDNWTDDERVKGVFKRFSKRVDEICNLIQGRNADPKNKNRNGPVKVPYELLYPKSGPGLTNKGVPNSISI
uniref:Lipoxygenase-4 n=1 Tax=Physcomitrium patens TaxID=3218 RepID=A4ZFY9_PHYPA|nr:lipoxygenase-4 [Physcomitrium patens]